MNTLALTRIFLVCFTILASIPTPIAIAQTSDDEPQTAEDFFDRGKAFAEEGEYALAIADYDAALLLDAEYAPTYVQRGLAYLKMDDHEQAFEDFDQAIELDPELRPGV